MIWIILGVFVLILIITWLWCVAKISSMIEEKDKK